MPMGGMMIHPIPCQIPWTAIQRWCEVNDYDEDRSLFLDHCIMAMDNVYVKWEIEQATKKKG